MLKHMQIISLRYLKKFCNEKAEAYLTKVLEWLDEELKENSWEYEIK